MDPVTIATSVTALAEVASNVIRYLYSVKNASSEQKKLRNEVAIVSGLLTALDRPQEDMEAEDEGFTTIRALTVDGGAVDQCKESLEKLRSKTHNDKVSGIEKIGRNFTWHFGKDEINEALMNVERLKSSLDLALTNDVGLLVQKIKVNSDVLTRDVSELKDDVRGQKIDQERQEVGNWLSPFDFRAIQQEIFHRCHAGTGKWILESEKFQQWSSSHNDTLWCPGIPGAGKTYLAAIIIDYLRRKTSLEGQDAVLCLFCNFNEQANQTAYNFIGALLKQLVQASRTLSCGIRSIYDTRAKGRGPDFKELADIFRTELKRFSKTFIIIDALDEVSESADIRTILLKELRSCPVNLLVTSRHDPTIKKQFSEAQRCDIIAADEDIRSYISERIEQENRLTRQIRSFPSFKDEIPARIVGSAKGM